MVTDIAQSIKIKKAATTQDNAKRTLPKKGEKTIHKKRKLHEIPEISTATQGDKGCTQLLDQNFALSNILVVQDCFLQKFVITIQVKLLWK